MAQRTSNDGPRRRKGGCLDGGSIMMKREGGQLYLQSYLFESCPKLGVPYFVNFVGLFWAGFEVGLGLGSFLGVLQSS